MPATRIESLGLKHQIRNYIVGSVMQNVSRDAQFIAPRVNVPSLVNTVFKYDRKTPFRVPDTRRASGGRATEVNFGGTPEDITLQLNALDTGIEVMAQSDDEIIMNLQTQVDIVTSLAGLAHFKEATTLIQAAMNAASATATIDISDDDPIAKIDSYCKDILLSCGDASSNMQLRFLWGWNALAKVLADAQVIARVNGGATTNTPATPTVETIKRMLIFPNTEHRLSLAIQDTGEQASATEARSFVLDNQVLIVAATENPTKADPSAFKTFWYGADGMRGHYYSRDDKRVESFGLDWAYKIYAANPAASKLVTVQD